LPLLQHFAGCFYGRFCWAHLNGEGTAERRMCLANGKESRFRSLLTTFVRPHLQFNGISWQEVQWPWICSDIRKEQQPLPAKV